MLTETRFRLLAADPTRKSGYRVVGYLRWVAYPDGERVWLWKNELAWHPCCPSEVKFDAIEQSICVDGTWYYEGDRVNHPVHGTGTLIYFEHYIQSWEILFNKKAIAAPVFLLPETKVIGTIHDERVV